MESIDKFSVAYDLFEPFDIYAPINPRWRRHFQVSNASFVYVTLNVSILKIDRFSRLVMNYYQIFVVIYISNKY